MVVFLLLRGKNGILPLLASPGKQFLATFGQNQTGPPLLVTLEAEDENAKYTIFSFDLIMLPAIFFHYLKNKKPTVNYLNICFIY